MISTELKSFISRIISDEITKNKCKLQHCKYPHDRIFPLIKKEIADAVSNREKEIAEEVEKILENYKVKEEPLCEQNVLIKIIEGRILSILKH